MTGPYVDRAGRDLTDLDGDPALVGTLMLAGHALAGGRAWLAPGHASVLTDGDRQLLVHHVRDADDPTQHEVQVRRLVWTADGWPAVSPQPWAGAAEPDDDAAHRPGRAGRHVGAGDVRPGHRRRRGHLAHARRSATTSSRRSGRTATGSSPGRASSSCVFPSVDAVRGVRTLSFAGLDADGNATLGTRVVES